MNIIIPPPPPPPLPAPLVQASDFASILTLQVEEELARQKLLNQQTRDRYARLKMDNMELREKICLLERLPMYTYRRESACMVEFQQLHLKETY